MTFDVRASAPGLSSALRLVAVDLNFGTSGITADLDTLDAGDVVLSAWANVKVAFNAGTTNVITLGDGTTADKFLAAADVAEGTPGISPAGGKGPFAPEAAAGTLRGTYTQTGTAASTGQSTLYALIASAPA